MKIGIMNNPSKSVHDEAMFCGKAGFDFPDSTAAEKPADFKAYNRESDG